MSAAVPVDHQNPASRSGLERAAIALLGLGEELAASVLEKMPAERVNELAEILPTIKGVVESELDGVMSSLLAETSRAPMFTDKSGMNRAVQKVLGEKRARELLQTAEGVEYADSLEKLLMLDPKIISRLVGSEHPQLQAVTLACLDPVRSAEVLALMSESVRADVTRRLAALSTVPSSSLEAVAGLIDGLTEQEVSSYSIKGAEQLAEVLNHMDHDVGEALIENLKTADEGLAEQVAALRFTFEHVMELDIASLRVLVEYADDDILAMAMRGLPLARKEQIYACLGKRAAATLKDEVETGEGVRKSRVMAAREQLTETARLLAAEGQIELGGSSDEMVE
ncbi:hypothetical protein EOPP23_13175 [Endozoicomonas sp. OPT23]|uniref:FliG C-terminal domain-containing protein n=1 Tax=Endozoicomonas sp. OPT23 TaxID=2072845 RepID=UPI00129B1A80|nr:FliG C-terminal domain-containing protein [Endozoicomonas sp. OPT23]MRI33941.1 hypothetical protein [Endozoicomonas sp. OPT23]